MKTNLKQLKIFVVAVLLISAAKAQMTLNGEIRPRAEYRYGYQSPMDSVSKSSMFISQRTRLNFGYSGENFKVGVSLQDVSVWGSQSQLTSTSATSLMHEAWGQYWFCPKFSAKIGRQEVSYDDERLFGATAWNQQGRHHDLFLGIFEDTASKFTIHFGAAYNRDAASNTGANYTVANSYRSMEYLWTNKKIGDFGASLIFINVGWQSPVGKNASRCYQTAGTHLEYKKDANL